MLPVNVMAGTENHRGGDKQNNEWECRFHKPIVQGFLAYTTCGGGLNAARNRLWKPVGRPFPPLRSAHTALETGGSCRFAGPSSAPGSLAATQSSQRLVVEPETCL